VIRGRGDAGGEVSRVEVSWNSGNRSSEQVLADGEIQSWLASLLWCTSRYENMSATCARAREEERCRGGRSMLTVTGGEIGNQWRRVGFELRSLAAFRLGFLRG
jgi:hypothetical protein